jgi:AcrR family transcriptional regulator
MNASPIPITASPSRMSAAARREQLLDVTGEIVTEQGFHAVSIQAVARRAGISRPIVYEHFGDLPGLLEALVEREMTKAHAQISETELGDLSEGDPAGLMLESLSRYLSAVERHPTTWRLVLIPAEGAPESLRKSIARGRATVLDSLTNAVRPVLRGDGQAPDPELTARILSAMADEYARLHLTDPSRYGAERLLAHAAWWIDHTGIGFSGIGLTSHSGEGA